LRSLAHRATQRTWSSIYLWEQRQRSFGKSRVKSIRCQGSWISPSWTQDGHHQRRWEPRDGR
jgi:hypothetical protein